MKARENLKQAFSNLASAKLRSLLAVLGILVGTASVVALVSIGQLATQKALEQFKALGTDLLALSFYAANPSAPASPANTLTRRQLQDMARQVPGIAELSPYITLYAAMSFSGHKLDGTVIGATQSLSYTIKINMKEGRFISFLDAHEHLCVIGSGLYQKIKEVTHKNPLGQQINVGGNSLTIMGVADTWPENSFFNEDINRSLLIPIDMSLVIDKNAQIRNVIMRLQKNADAEKLQNDITAFVKKNAPDLKIFFRSAKQLIKSMKSQQQIFTLLLGMIGGISLLVGGIGVMNVMLVSVAERRREIGIRMAIGARRRDIRGLFLFEAIALALFGGVMGVILGISVSLIIAYFADWGFGIYLMPPLIGFAVSVATGVFFGFYPAHRAAKLDPIETLRYD